MVYDRKNGSPTGVQIEEKLTDRNEIELSNFALTIHQTCELIEFLKKEYGLQNPWPTLQEPFDRGYGRMLGKRMYPGYMPEGFVPKVEHLETMVEDIEDEETEDA